MHVCARQCDVKAVNTFNLSGAARGCDGVSGVKRPTCVLTSICSTCFSNSTGFAVHAVNLFAQEVLMNATLKLEPVKLQATVHWEQWSDINAARLCKVA